MTPEPEESSPTPPSYTIADSSFTARPGKTEVIEEIALEQPADEPAIRALLLLRYAAAMERRSEFHSAPTAISIRVYSTREQATAGEGLWLAMLSRYPDDQEPRIQVDARAIDYALDPPRERFGLEPHERAQLYRDLIRVERRARAEAQEEFPLLPLSDPSYTEVASRRQFDAQARRIVELEERYDRALLAEYGITPAVADSVGIEGAIAKWPGPPVR